MGNAELVDTLEGTWRSLIALCEALGPADWGLPTGCPGWTVKDGVAHVAGLEDELAGRPVPPVELPELDRLSSPEKRHMEQAVELRRAVPPERLLAELRAVTAERGAQLRALLEAEDGDPTVTAIMGFPWPLHRLLPIRIFDTWSHEQDIRRATGRPGHLDGPAVELSLRIIVRGVSSAMGRAGLPDGTAVLVEVSEPAPRTLRLAVGDGPARDGAEPAAVLRMDLPDLIARACGRRDGGGAYLGRVTVEGDAAVAARALDCMAVTP
jgi:uncharacterized protein (TIGR03083 family)